MERELLQALEHALGELTPEDQRMFDANGQVQSATLRKRRQRAIERLRFVWRRLYGEP